MTIRDGFRGCLTRRQEPFCQTDTEDDWDG